MRFIRENSNTVSWLRLVLLSVLAIFFFVACLSLSEASAATSASKASAKVKLSRTTKNITAGQSFTLKVKNLKSTGKKKVKIKDENGKAIKDKNGKYKYEQVKVYPKIKWASSKKSIATVDKEGNVSAIHYGAAVISAKVKGKTYRCKLNVRRPNYTVTPYTVPLPASKYAKLPAYNAYTKNYYMLRSYTEDLEKRGGGTLTLSPGTYNVTNVVYIPSDTTIYLQSDAIISKTRETHTSKLSPAKSVFHFCAPSKARAASGYTGKKLGKYKYGYTNYSGVHDSRIIGYGNAAIDLNGITDQYGILMVHAKNILVTGITVRGIRNGHGVEVNSSAEVIVSKCQFIGDRRASSKADEGVNIDTADLRTGGISVPYCGYDNTASRDVTVQQCKFYDLPRAVGSHTYSYEHPHLRINVKDNTIEDSMANAIGAMYWKDCVISGNNIDNIEGKYKAIVGYGAIHLTISGNKFSNMYRVAEFGTRELDDYPMIVSQISEANLNMLKTENSFTDITDLIVPITDENGMTTTFPLVDE